MNRPICLWAYRVLFIHEQVNIETTSPLNPRHLQQILLDAVEEVISQTDIGKLKKGDLSGFRVHKFTMGQQLILLAYKLDSESITFYQAGPHENFYKNLKIYL